MCENSYFEDRVPAEIKQIIFDYLSHADLLNLCLTCKSLNDFIGQSHDCMKKFWIKFYSFKLKDLESLALTSRNYEKLKVNRVKLDEHFKFVSHLSQDWRKVLIYNCEFKSIDRFLKFVDSLAELVEEIEISDIEVLNNDYQVCALKFPNLKRVMFRNVPSTTIEVFLGANKTLENAAFDIVQVVEGKMPVDDLIHKFLQNSQNLNHLQLGSHYIKSLFDREEVNMKFDFKLTKLFLKFPIIRDDSPMIERNISSFLTSQPNIDWIVFWELQNEQILCTGWNKIPSINHVTFIGLESLFDDSMDLAVDSNPNIIHLELLSRKVLISQLRKLLSAAPCLRILHVQILTRYILEFTARNHQVLKELRFVNIDEDVPEIYNQLKASTEDVNRSIVFKQATFWHDPSNPFSVDPVFWHT